MLHSIAVQEEGCGFHSKNPQCVSCHLDYYEVSEERQLLLVT